jgi:AcrR family transcriptional regulator
MARPPDPRRRAQTLTAATDYVLEHGLAGLSLRPLAEALGTSTRMLLYDFGSKEELILAVLAEARRRESALLADAAASGEIARADLIRGVWSWASAPERSRFMRLFFEVYIQALLGSPEYSGQAQAMVTDWLGQFARTFTAGAAEADPIDATLLIAVLRGLLLDQISTGDTTRTSGALERFVQLLSSAQGDAEGQRQP